MPKKKIAGAERIRCGWAKGERYIQYHDEE